MHLDHEIPVLCKRVLLRGWFCGGLWRKHEKIYHASCAKEMSDSFETKVTALSRNVSGVFRKPCDERKCAGKKCRSRIFAARKT